MNANVGEWSVRQRGTSGRGGHGAGYGAGMTNTEVNVNAKTGKSTSMPGR